MTTTTPTSSNKPGSGALPVAQSVSSTSDINSLVENLKQTESKRTSSEDMIEQVTKNWKNGLVGIVFVIVLAVGLKYMKEGRERASGNASQTFERVQEDFGRLFLTANTVSGEELKNLERAFEDKIKAIEDVDQRSSYAKFGELYRATGDFYRGEFGKAKERLKIFNLTLLNSSSKMSEEQLLTELALLIKSKVLLAEEGTKNEGKELLKEVAKKTRVVSGEALISYIRLFGVDQTLIDEVLASHPGLSEGIKGELGSLGAAVL